MTFVSDEEKQIDYLAERYLSQTLDEGESARLLSLLERNAHDVVTVHENILANSLLKDVAAEDDDLLVLPDLQIATKAVDYPNAPPAATRRIPSLSLLGLIAISLLIGALVGVHFFYSQGPTQAPLLSNTEDDPSHTHVESSRPAPGEATTSAVAVVSKLVNAVWANEHSSLGSGSIISPGWLRLKSGMVRVQFFSGVNVVLEGPTDFMIVDTNQAYCPMGNFLVEAPEQSIGFTVNVPQMSVIDKGTAFMMLVRSESSEVRVIKGKVELAEIPGGLELLNEGDAAEVDSSGRVRRFKVSESEITLVQTFDEAVQTHQNSRFQHWQAMSRKVALDPTTLVHFDMEFLSSNDFRLLNNAETGKRVVGDGIVVGCRKGMGHLSQKGSLEFSQISDRVRFHVPNRLFSLTIITRVRIDSVDRLNHCLLSSDQRPSGGIAWVICRENSPNGVPFLRFAVNGKNEGETVHYDTEPYFTPARIGQWVELAVVVDDTEKTVCQYVDGRQVSRLPLKHESPIQIGRTELCNRSSESEDSSYQVRHFSGGMDEFILCSHALSGEEIRRLHESYNNAEADSDEKDRRQSISSENE